MPLAGLLWLIMVGMDTMEPSSRGVLGVVIRDREESPEEQYDRLVRLRLKIEVHSMLRNHTIHR